MAKVGQAGSGLLPSGAVGFSNIMEVDDQVPQGYRPTITYINSRGKRVDPYGRKVKEEGTHQAAGVSNSPEQKASTSYAPTKEDMMEDDELLDSEEESGNTDEDDE